MKDSCPLACVRASSDHWECLWNELPKRRHHYHHVVQRHRLPTCTDFHLFFFNHLSFSLSLSPSFGKKRASAAAAGDVCLPVKFDISCHSPCGKGWCPPRCWAAPLTAHSAATNTLTTTAAASWLESQLKSSHYVCLNEERKNNRPGEPERSCSWLHYSVKQQYMQITHAASSGSFSFTWMGVFLSFALVPSSGTLSSELGSEDWVSEWKTSRSEFSVQSWVQGGGGCLFFSFLSAQLVEVDLTLSYLKVENTIMTLLPKRFILTPLLKQQGKKEKIDLMYSQTEEQPTEPLTEDSLKKKNQPSVKQPRTLFRDRLAPSLPSGASWGGQGLFYTYCMKTVKRKALILSIVYQHFPNDENRLYSCLFFFF